MTSSFMGLQSTPGFAEQGLAGRLLVLERYLKTIRLMSADPVVYPDGLCAQPGWPQTAGQEVTLQTCATGDIRRQQWSFDSSSNFRGTTDGKALNELC